jgi:hypothetical protein
LKAAVKWIEKLQAACFFFFFLQQFMMIVNSSRIKNEISPATNCNMKVEQLEFREALRDLECDILIKQEGKKYDYSQFQTRKLNDSTFRFR